MTTSLHSIPLYPFSAGELAGAAEGFLPRLFVGAIGQSKSPSTREDIAMRVTRGGYPEATQREADDRRAAWFASYISTILQRDVRDLARVDALHSLPNLLKLLAARASGLLNLADVGRDAGLPHTTLTRYLALLETVFLVHRLPAWSRNLGQRLVKAPKLHLVDTGLACHLLGADARRLSEDRPLLGRLLESYVVGEIRKQVSWADSQITLYHYRTATGSEVDIVLEKPDGSVAAIEVKASATVSASDRRPSTQVAVPTRAASENKVRLKSFAHSVSHSLKSTLAANSELPCSPCLNRGIPITLQA